MQKKIMGQHMERIKTGTRKSENGYISNVNHYQEKRCKDFPLQCLCHKSQGNRIIEVNHCLNAFRREARERLTSDQGLIYRSRRPIEPEAVFGQTKENKQYRRFRHFGGEKVKMDFAIFAIAFNIGKLYNKGRKTASTGEKSAVWGTKTGFVVIGAVFIRKKGENRKYLQRSYPLAA
jgi:hypothetical protein